MKTVWALLGLAGGMSCTGASSGPRVDTCLAAWTVTPWVELGTGSDSFVGVDSGDGVPVVRTPQGLLAVYGSLVTAGILPGVEDDLTDPSNPRVTFEIWDEGLWIGGYARLPRPMHPIDVHEAELLGDILALDPETAYEALGRPVEMRVEVVDACGTVVQDAREVVLWQAFSRGPT